MEGLEDPPQADHFLTHFQAMHSLSFHDMNPGWSSSPTEIVSPQNGLLGLFLRFLMTLAEFEQGQMKNFKKARCPPYHRGYVPSFRAIGQKTAEEELRFFMSSKCLNLLCNYKGRDGLPPFPCAPRLP